MNTLDFQTATSPLAAYLQAHGYGSAFEIDMEEPALYIDEAISLEDAGRFFAEALNQPRLADYFPQEEAPLALPLAGVRLEWLVIAPNDEGQLELDFQLTWDVPPQSLLEGIELRQIKVVFSVRGHVVKVTVEGLLTLFDMTLDVQIQLPGLLATASLRGDDRDVPTQMRAHLPGADHGTKPQLQDLELRMALRSRRLLWHMQVENLVDLDDLKLPALQVDLDYGGGLQGAVSGRAWGDLLIPLEGEGQLVMFLQAERDDSGAWTLEGSLSPAGVSLPALLDSLGQALGAGPLSARLPAALQECEIAALALSYETERHTFTFDVDVQLELAQAKDGQTGHTADVALRLVAAGRGADATHSLDGVITVAGRTFELTLDDSGQGQTLIASLQPEEALRLPDLVAALGVDSQLAPPLTISVEDVLLAHEPGRTLFSLALKESFSLLDLPLLGALPGASVSGGGVGNLQLLYATETFSPEQVAAINALLGEGVAPLPEGGRERSALNKGFNVSASLDLGDADLDLSTAGREQAVSDPGQAPPAPKPGGGLSPTSPPAGGKWVDVQKKIGSLFARRIGVRYEGGELWFLVDADLTVSALTLSLDGLGVSSPLDDFSPHFHLQGVGVDFKRGELEIGGSFLHSGATGPDGQPLDEYSGMLLVKAESFALTAIGSYANMQGHPSFFAYLALDYPLGGPTFFYVTGLAAGFGYNRRLLPVPAEQVAQFPLVSQAQSGAGMGSSSDPAAIRATLGEQMQLLNQYIPPTLDEYFLAIGVSFTSFELIHGFVLITADFGQDFILNVLGTLSYTTPSDLEPGAPALVHAALGITATFDPGHGFLGVRAVLDASSYLFDHDCHLRGGMAFYSWFKGDHAGDFVLTMGGYHPHFQPPAHYPQVPRLGFDWQITDELSISGSAYFALTGHAFMAGGALKALYQSGDLSAWFSAGADFLIQWKPYHYEIGIHVELGAALVVHAFGTHKVSGSLGAALEIWGPEFAGTVSATFAFISVEVSFGPDKQEPLPLIWEAFRKAFLPAADGAMIAVSARGGLVREMKGYHMDEEGQVRPSQNQNDSHWLMAARDFHVAVDAAIPANRWQIGDGEEQTASGTAFGISPMDVRPDGVTSVLHVTVERWEKGWVKLEMAIGDVAGSARTADPELRLKPIRKAVPAALWATVHRPDVNHSPLLPGVFTGFELVPGRSPRPGQTHSVPRKNLAFDTELVDGAAAWHMRNVIPVFDEGAEVDEVARRNLLSCFLPDETIDEHDGRLTPEMLVAQPPSPELREGV